MKKLFACLLLLVLWLSITDLNAKVNLTSDLTLEQAAGKIKIPVKKLIEITGLDSGTNINQTLAELDLTEEEILKAENEFRKTRNYYYLGIVIIGMLIVFLSLALVGWVINQLKFLQGFSKEKKIAVQTSLGKIISTPEHLSRDAIIAVISTVYLHELEAREQNKLLLTWKRSSLSLWRAAGKINMPNRLFPNGLRRQK